MYQILYRFLIELTNRRASSWLIKRFAESSWSRHFIASFVKVYHINKDEIRNEIGSFQSLHELFIRTLKDGARPVVTEPYSVASPVDGVLEEYGTIAADKNITVKEKVYSIEEMLGNDEVLQKYIGGTYMILYLSPSNYHRVHSPVSGKVCKRWACGRRSYPVNKLGLKYGRRPLSKNFRTITEVKHAAGHISIIKVGAMFINSIVITDRRDELVKGEEFAYFSFGSTVVLLFEKDTFALCENLQLPSEVRVGQKLGRLY